MVKAQIEQIYLNFLSDVNKGSDGNHSIYTMGSNQFSGVEKQLNALILCIHERMEEQQELAIAAEQVNQPVQAQFECFTPGYKKKSVSDIKRASTSIARKNNF